MNSRVIYTCIFGGYDQLRDSIRLDGWDYVCFTDQDFESDIWDVRKLPNGGIYTSREIKMRPHIWLKDYKEWFYIDGSISIEKPFELKCKYGWLGFRHRTPDPWCEFHRIVNADKGDLGIITRQLNDYSDEFVEPGCGHMAGGVLYRKNTAKVRRMNDLWWEEFNKYPSRDQIALYKILHQFNNWSYLNHFISMNNFVFEDHLSVPTNRNPNGNIYEFTPSGIGERLRDYGAAVNQCCEIVPNDEDWIIIRDQDCMYFPDTNHRKIVRDAADRYPDTGVFGAYTNRIGLKWQLLELPANEETDIKKLHKVAIERSKLGSDCLEVNLPIAGFFMMFKKGTWKSCKFTEGDMGQSEILFDWDFSQRVMSMGLKTRLIKGLYLFHYYRFHKYIKDTSHIFDEKEIKAG